MMTTQNKAYLFAAVSVVLWSTIAVAFKVSLRTLDPFQVVFGASAVSLMIFVVINLVRRGVDGMATMWSGSSLFRSAGMGFLNPFLYYVVLIHAYDMITAQEAMTLNYIWPIMLALLSVPLLGQGMGWRSLAALVISFGGIVVIATRGNLLSLQVTSLAGCALAAGSSVVWALYWIFNMKDQREIPEKLMMNFLFGTLYAAVAVTLFSSWGNTIPSDWGGALYLGFFEMGFTFLLWLTALKYSQKTYQVSQLIFLAPPLSLVWIHLVLHEPILPSTIAGLVLILAGILLQQKKKS
jgi:drug/metabolite transporter (DMT)-like permease